MPYQRFDGELDSPNDNILAKFENVPALRQLDVALNQATGGGNETISARVGREKDKSQFAKAIADGLNNLDPGHTDRAVQNSNMRQSFMPFNSELDKPAAKPEAPLTGTQQLMRQLGLTGRAGLTGVTGMASVLADAGATGVNALGGNMKMPSQELQKLMTKAGLPEPKGDMENVVQVLSSMVAGTGDPISRALQAATAAKVPAGFGVTEASARAQTAKELHDAGIVLPPSMAEAGVGSRAVEGVGGTARTSDLAKYLNEPKINDLARKALKLPEGTALTSEVLSQQVDDLVKTGYEPVKQAGTITTGRVYRQALQKIHDDFSNKSFPELDKEQVLKLLQQVNKKQYEADDAVQIISRLRMEAKDAFKPGGDTQLGKAKLAITKALEDNIELNLQHRGPGAAQILDDFRATRTALAKNYAVGRMLADPSTGTISTIKAAALAKKTKLTDELALIAKAGAPAFNKATGPATGGKPVPFNIGDAMMMTGGSVAAPFTGGASAAVAAFPAVKNAARHVTLSQPMQNMMIRSAGKGGGSIFGGPVGGRAAFGIPAQLLPLFSQGDQ